MARQRMRIMVAAWAALVTLSGLAGCVAPPSDPDLVASTLARRPATAVGTSRLGGFTARLVDALPEGNVVVSPLSIATVVAMIRNGAAGDTAAGMDATLGTPIGPLNEELNAVLQALDALGGTQVQLTVANAVWAEQSLTWKTAFLDALAAWYGAGVRKADFRGQSPAVTDAINAWISGKTQGLIPRLVSPGMINSSTRMALVNAVYFRGSWEQQFNPDQTRPERFTTASGQQVDATTMHGMRFVPLLQTPAFTGVSLPFKGGQLALVALLPAEGRTLSLSDLTRDSGFGAVAAAPPQMVELALPRWKASFKAELSPTLRSLGMAAAFDPDRADLSGMTDAERLFVSFIVHQATINVDETGAEAAAATVGGISVTATPVTVPVRFDRPFVYALVHVPSQTVLFAGRVTDPTTA